MIMMHDKPLYKGMLKSWNHSSYTSTSKDALTDETDFIAFKC